MPLNRFSRLGSRITHSTKHRDELETVNPSDKTRQYGCWSVSRPETDDIEVDIVFVHGITGSQTGTWAAKDRNGNDILWPRDLLSTHSQIPNSRIIFFGYDADVVNFWTEAGQNRVSDHARSLAQDLGTLRMRTNTMGRPIIFVAHSMGGIVVQEALTKSHASSDAHVEDVYRATFGISFMSTPCRGSGLAFWASIGGKFLSTMKRTNGPLLRILKQGSEVLDGIQERFHALVHKRQDAAFRQMENLSYPIRIHCFFEELSLKAVGKVVERESACMDGWPSSSIHANHMDMVRFANAEDSGFKRVAGVLWAWVQESKVVMAAGDNFANTPQQLPSDQHSPSRANSPAIVHQNEPDGLLGTRDDIGETRASRPILPFRLAQSISPPHGQFPSNNDRPGGDHRPEPSTKGNVKSDTQSGRKEETSNTNRQNRRKQSHASTFNINQTQGGRWMVAETINIRSGRNVFETASNDSSSDPEESSNGSG
ncbi:hypothetical protein FQN50_007023 [Emmonsiellopsis sp. PD_5]|nr:hypothetical protein FQN50_007023 [Emmonsiellopsis sp. PD_5]